MVLKILIQTSEAIESLHLDCDGVSLCLVSREMFMLSFFFFPWVISSPLVAQTITRFKIQYHVHEYLLVKSQETPNVLRVSRFAFLDPPVRKSKFEKLNAYVWNLPRTMIDTSVTPFVKLI